MEELLLPGLYRNRNAIERMFGRLKDFGVSPLVMTVGDNFLAAVCLAATSVHASTRAPVGTVAGAKNGRGYRQIRFDGRPYSASRLAWLYMTGKWPNFEISYLNGKPSDTRWANLRKATSSSNRNHPKRK